MRPGRKNGIKPDGWKIELELGNKQDLLEIGKQKQIRKPMDFVLSKNDKTDPPHNTQKIIAESWAISRTYWRLGGRGRQWAEEIKNQQQQNRVCQKMTNLIRHTIRGQLSPRVWA